MAASSRSQVLSLYKLLMKESSKFPSYNYRTYALRRVRDAFKENKHVEDSKTVEVLLNKARDNLAVLQRQVSIGQMYATQKIVVEEHRGKKTI
uniref:LYR motif containing 4 n=1 Tax=Lepisosteus oculatus TaxID=7918 RepID=W5N120_LEPOC|nr:PREDICTED: LYR motif-containing protein 4 [Lepisosteus oculatus]